jgi:hypothetical protein
MIETTEWYWGEAFSKFGFQDGDGLNMTDRVAHVIENLGYETLPRDIIAELNEHFGPDESMW